MTVQSNEDLLEIYASASAMEAERLVLMLAEDGIEALARETTISSFPAGGQHLILVKSSDREKALKTISAARRDGAISDRGEML